MGSKPVPYRFITGLDPVAQREIERNFAWLTDSLVPNSHGNTYLIAASEATDLEKSQADLVCTGTADQVLLNAFVADHDHGVFRFSHGRFYFTGGLICDANGVNSSCRFEGIVQGDVNSNVHPGTEFYFGGNITDYSTADSLSFFAIKAGSGFQITNIHVDATAVVDNSGD
jgi:hypothetical protein